MTKPPTTTGFEAILAAVRTTRERDMLMQAIDACIKNLYHTKPAPLEELLAEIIPYTIAKPLITTMRKQLKDQTTAAIEEFFNKLTEALQALKVLELELAFEAQEPSVALLSRWIREHIGPDVIVEFTEDPLLLGGARIAFQGKFKEINLADVIESVLIRESARIQKILA